MTINNDIKPVRPHVSIIGSGPAGLTAAIYAARAGKRVVIFGEDLGQLSTTTWVENYPGIAEPIMGPDLINNMRKQAESVGVDFIEEKVVELEVDKGEFVLKTESGATFISNSCILAMGSKPKWLGLDSETKYRGYGVSSCATCDGAFYKGMHVLVVGGGNTAVEEALYLSNIAEKVTLIHRRDKLRAEQILQKRLFVQENIEILWDTELHEVFGEDQPVKKVTGALLYNNKTEESIKCDVSGIFIAIGHHPQTSLIKNFNDIELKDGYIKSRIITRIPGLFVAGDIADHIYRQAITAAGDGCRAALEAVRWLEGIVIARSPIKSSTKTEHSDDESYERPARRDRGDRPMRSDRPAGGFRDRGPRTFDRPSRTFSNRSERSERPERSERSDRPERSEGGFGSERPARPDGGFRSDRPGRSGGGFGGGFRSDRPARSGGGFGGGRGSDRSDRPRSGFGSGSRFSSQGSSFGSERPARPDGGFRSDRPARPGGGFRSDRPARSGGGFRSDRPGRSGGGFGGGFRSDRPARSGGDKPGFGGRGAKRSRF